MGSSYCFFDVSPAASRVTASPTITYTTSPFEALYVHFSTGPSLSMSDGLPRAFSSSARVVMPCALAMRSSLLDGPQPASASSTTPMTRPASACGVIGDVLSAAWMIRDPRAEVESAGNPSAQHVREPCLVALAQRGSDLDPGHQAVADHEPHRPFAPL